MRRLMTPKMNFEKKKYINFYKYNNSIVRIFMKGYYSNHLRIIIIQNFRILN